MSFMRLTDHAREFWRNRFGPIEANTRATARYVQRIDEARGRGSGITIEGSEGGEPVAVTLVDTGAGDNIVSSSQLPTELGPGGGMTVEGVVDGIPVEVRGTVSLEHIPVVSLATADTTAITQVGDSAASVQLLAPNEGRLQASFFNDSTAIAYLKLGATASTASYTVKMAAGGFYELPHPVYTGVIDAIWASDAGGVMAITEFT